MKNNKNLLGITCILICEVFFGFSYLFTKNITNRVSPVNLLSWRFIIAFLLINICVITGLFKVSFKGKSVMKLAVMAIFHPVLYFVGETFGITLTTASESATIIASLPLVTIIVSALVLKKLPTRLQTLGVCVTFSGIIVITASKGFELILNPFGYLALFLGIISYSIYAVFAEMSTEFSSAEKTYVMIFSGFVTFTAMALVDNAKHGSLKDFVQLPFSDMSFLVAILYLGAGCGVIAFLTNNIAISCIGTNRCASFVGVSTIVSIIAGILILGENFSPFQIAGAILVLAGVYLANLKKAADGSHG